ncbi:hypothetical protein ACH5RR_007428 [Cinchona calisaya]|uniref:NB-ARC domain-containing protein n=1 Tax=Cinchona calisaya TaxID=153742 RepID=A0ABD3AS94_9GENT
MFTRSVCILKQCYVSHSIGADIDSLKTKISDHTKSFEEYEIRAIMEREGGTSSLEQVVTRTYSLVIEDDSVGLEGDVELLVENLVMEDEIQHFRVVSIYGMGGLGKPTLAQKYTVTLEWRVTLMALLGYVHHKSGKRKACYNIS